MTSSLPTILTKRLRHIVNTTKSSLIKWGLPLEGITPVTLTTDALNRQVEICLYTTVITANESWTSRCNEIPRICFGCMFPTQGEIHHLRSSNPICRAEETGPRKQKRGEQRGLRIISWHCLSKSTNQHRCQVDRVTTNMPACYSIEEDARQQ